MFSIALSLEKGLQVRMGDSEVALDVPKAVKEAIDEYSPITFTDHSEVPELTLPVKAGQ